jgi:alpha,alpha-trehalase
MKLQTEGALFEAVQRSRLFADGKSFVDAETKSSPEQITLEFQKLLEQFVGQHFEVPQSQSVVPTAQRTLAAHIDALWSLLERSPTETTLDSSLISLPAPYIVPGGRFRELYYWDTYFSALGLVYAGRQDLILALAQNFSSLIERYGFIPNGTRTYFLSRSQPPFFVCLLELIETEFGHDAITPFLPSLEREYTFWMRQGEHAVNLPNGAILNRYWDCRNTAREESFLEDTELATHNPNNATLFRERRSGAESGWDFSSRWNENPLDPGTIRTTELAAIDLNCLLYHLELKLGHWLENPAFTAAAESRKHLILEHFYDDAQGWFFDLEHASGKRTDAWTLAGMFPLFFGIATPEQAAKTAAHLESKFLHAGGLTTTLTESGEQWDAPNGWAPLQWIACIGLERYGFADLAREIAHRFVNLADSVWQRTGKLMEKYDVFHTDLEAGGGEYPAQDGFGWTNGVVRAMIERYGKPV